MVGMVSFWIIVMIYLGYLGGFSVVLHEVRIFLIDVAYVFHVLPFVYFLSPYYPWLFWEILRYFLCFLAYSSLMA